MNDEKLQSIPSADSASSPGRVRFNFWRWFWISTLVGSLTYAWYCFYVPANQVAWAADFASAEQQAAQSGKPMILFFTGKWCVPCRIMKREVWSDEQVRDSVNAGFVPVTIDVDGPDAAATLARYGVGATPVTVVADPQGKVLQQSAGKMSKADFLEMIGKVKLRVN